MNTALTHEPSNDAVKSISVSNNNSFTTVRHRNERRRDRPVIVDAKKSDQFYGVGPRIDFCVRHVLKEYPKKYVRDMVFDTKVEILALHKVFHTDFVMMSYKLITWRDDEDELMQPND